MTRTKKIDVLIVDDHAILRDGLERALTLNSLIGQVKQAQSGIQALKILEKFEPDIVFMDILMEGMDGIEATLSILDNYPQTKIIAFSQCDDKDHIKGMFTAGAKGYIVKTSGIDVINEAIETVIEGKHYFTKELSDIVFSGTNNLNVYGEPHKISPRELKILKLIVGGFKVRQIAEEMFLSVRTIEWHKENIMQKLDVTSTPQLVKRSIELGLISKP